MPHTVSAYRKFVASASRSLAMDSTTTPTTHSMLLQRSQAASSKTFSYFLNSLETPRPDTTKTWRLIAHAANLALLTPCIHMLRSKHALPSAPARCPPARPPGPPCVVAANTACPNARSKHAPRDTEGLSSESTRTRRGSSGGAAADRPNDYAQGHGDGCEREPWDFSAPKFTPAACRCTDLANLDAASLVTARVNGPGSGRRSRNACFGGGRGRGKWARDTEWVRPCEVSDKQVFVHRRTQV